MVSSVAVACLNNGPYLFRSYDHPEPAPGLVRPQRSSAGPASDGLHLNPGPASEIPVWKVGRATSAAPGWFEPMIIDEEVFLDGAVARSNNPVEIAYNEVKQLSPLHEPKIVISIGTNAKAPKASPVTKRTKLFLTLGMIRDAVMSFKDSILASRKRHQDFMTKHQLSDHDEQLASDDKAMYFRFDVPDSLPFEDVRLGDWKGENGSATKSAIRGPTYQYLNQASTRAKLLRCARELVAIRRQRARTARWESFAFDARLYYLCPEKDDSLACQALRFDSRYHLRQHAFERHGFARRVPCIYHGTAHDGVPRTIEWTCSKDDCEEQILGFDNRDDFIIHLQSQHDRLVPRLPNSREFESWLDSGRRQLDADDPRKPTRRTRVDWAK